jgi:toxin ParE1/3/4
VRLGDEAERDLEAILRWTAEAFGPAQARRYRAVLKAAIGELVGGPGVVGSRAREEVLPGLRTVHVARKGRRGRHLLMYRVVGEDTIEVVRILHDAMELTRHVPAEDDAPM